MPFRHRLALAVLLTPLTVPFAGCGESPPAAKVHPAIEGAVRARIDIFDGGPQSAQVVAIEIPEWKKEEFPGDDAPVGYTGEWTARLRFQEPLAMILNEVDGTKIVHVVAKEGEELEFAGEVEAVEYRGEWQVQANGRSEPDQMAGPWTPMWEAAEKLAKSHPDFDLGHSSAGGPGAIFQPLSRMEPYVEAGSAEAQALLAAARAR
jgi:hypothetical protein